MNRKVYPNYGLIRVSKLCVTLVGALALGFVPLSADQISEIQIFMPAGPVGDVGGDIIEPGLGLPPEDLVPGVHIFPASDDAYGRLKRKQDRVEVEIKTDGLPAGAYTVWWVFFNNPKNCVGPCDIPDLFVNPAAMPAVFFATGAIVEDEGDGLGSACFRDVHYVDEYRGAPIQNDILGSENELDPMKAEIHMIIKYHAAPIPIDPADPLVSSFELHDQTTTLFGNCLNANGFVPPMGGPVQCFDPQFVAFPAPNNKN